MEAGVAEDVGGLAGPGRLGAGAGGDPKAGAVGKLLCGAEEIAEAGCIAGPVIFPGLEQVEEGGFDGGDCGIELLQPG